MTEDLIVRIVAVGTVLATALMFLAVIVFIRQKRNEMREFFESVSTLQDSFGDLDSSSPQLSVRRIRNGALGAVNPTASIVFVFEKPQNKETFVSIRVPGVGEVTISKTATPADVDRLVQAARSALGQDSRP